MSSPERIFQKTPELVIITPVYEDRTALKRLLFELSVHVGSEAFVLVVDDGSLMEPVMPLDLSTSQSFNGAILKLRRNVGHQRAISVGISYAIQNLPNTRTIVVMDSDGEDAPHAVTLLMSELKRSGADIAVAVRMKRAETFGFKVFYWLYKSLFRILTGRLIAFGNFMAINIAAAERLSVMAETPIHLAASVLSSRMKLELVGVDRTPRYAGDSKMNFIALALHGFRAMMVFAEDLLVRVGVACGLVALMAVVMILLAVGLKAAGVATPGWFSVALGLLILILIQTGALALMTLLMTGTLKANQIDPTAHNLGLIRKVLTSEAQERK